MRALLMMAALGALLTGCTSNDACDGLGTCLALTAMPTNGAPVNIDQLVVTVAGQVNGRRTLPNVPRAVTLPQTVALEFTPPGGYMGPFGFTVEVEAHRAGVIVANGQTQVTLTTGHHEMLTVLMSVGAPMPGDGGDMAPPPPAVDMPKFTD